MNEIEKELFDKALKYAGEMELYHNLYEGKEYGNFCELPLLTKVLLAGDQLMHPPFGSYLRCSQSELVRVHRTSGTSNKPLMLALTANDVKNIRNTGKKAFDNAGLKPGDIVINCMNYCMWMGGFMDHQSLEATGAAVIPYGVGHTENLVELIRSIPGVCIHSTPSYLSRIQQVAEEKFGLTPRNLQIRKGFFGGEGGISVKSFRDKLEKLWGMEIYDANYGMSELMSIIGAEDLKKDGLHFTAGDVIYPKLFLEQDGNVSNANIQQGNIGELVLSNCCKEAQPLVRYRTGDIVEIIDAEKGSDIRKFKFRILGRSDDMLVIKGINFYPTSLHTIIAKYPECTGNFKIAVPKEGVIDRVRLYLEVGNTDIQEAISLINRLRRDIQSKYFVSCEIELVKELESGNNKNNLVERVEHL